MLKLYHEQAGMDNQGQMTYKVAKITNDDEVLATFNEDNGCIDLTVLVPYSGELLEHYVNGELICTRRIEKVTFENLEEGYKGHVLHLSDPI